MKKIGIVILAFLIIFITKVHALASLYLKVELPIHKQYKDLNKKKEPDYNKKKAKILANTYGIGLGYGFSDYVEAEVVYDQMKYVYYSSDEQVGIVSTTPLGGAVGGNELYTRARKIPSGSVTGVRGICSGAPDGFMTKEQFCGIAPPGQSTIKKYNSIAITMKLQTLIAAVKLKLHNKSRLTPFITLGAGASRMKIDEKNENLNQAKARIISDSIKLKNKTSFAYRAGVGTQIRIHSKVELELSARYFNYGKYKLTNDVTKKITGYDVSGGIVIRF